MDLRARLGLGERRVELDARILVVRRGADRGLHHRRTRKSPKTSCEGSTWPTGLPNHTLFSEEIARRLTDALAEPFPVSTESVALGASIGIALAPGLAEHPEEVIARADVAMYRAKQAGRGWEFAVADASA
ncbi:hypothetical protein BH20ACT18_BH20ACT18_07000 [soil metagenome]